MAIKVIFRQVIHCIENDVRDKKFTDTYYMERDITLQKSPCLKIRINDIEFYQTKYYQDLVPDQSCPLLDEVFIHENTISVERDKFMNNRFLISILVTNRHAIEDPVHKVMSLEEYFKFMGFTRVYSVYETGITKLIRPQELP